MRFDHTRLCGVAAAALLLASAGTAGAQGKGKAKREREHERSVVVGPRIDPRRDPRYDPSRDPRYEPGTDPRHEQRDDRRDARRIPPGLAKKPGGMPPGQYRKRYGANDGAVVLRDVLGRRGYTVVRNQDVGESRYVYYRLRDGATRRAIVSPGSDRLLFSNVPSSLLSEVLSRLY